MRHGFSSASSFFPSVICLALATAAAGCPTEVEPEDAGVDAFRVRFDAPPELPDVAGLDAFDPNNDANLPPDAWRPVDAGPPDTNLGTIDTGPCGTLDDSGLDVCACLPLGADCSAAPCTGGLVCVEDGCGSHCQVRAAACTAAADCPMGATCTPGPRGSFCIRATETCVDSRDCAAGFSCDAGVCTDRRIGCTLSDFELTCPFNFVCEPRLGAPFCVRAMPRCEGDGACPFGSCVDVDGDGRRECSRPGLCEGNPDCTAESLVCGVEPSRLVMQCLPAGLCNVAADCGAGRTCVDLWGDGQRECVLEGGSCSRQLDCPAGQLCASAYEGGAPSCLDVPLSVAR